MKTKKRRLNNAAVGFFFSQWKRDGATEHLSLRNDIIELKISKTFPFLSRRRRNELPLLPTHCHPPSARICNLNQFLSSILITMPFSLQNVFKSSSFDILFMSKLGRALFLMKIEQQFWNYATGKGGESVIINYIWCDMNGASSFLITFFNPLLTVMSSCR